MAARKPFGLRAARKLTRGLLGARTRLNNPNPGPEEKFPSFADLFADSVRFGGRSWQLDQFALVFHVDLFSIACHFRYCESICQLVE